MIKTQLHEFVMKMIFIRLERGAAIGHALHHDGEGIQNGKTDEKQRGYLAVWGIALGQYQGEYQWDYGGLTQLSGCY